MKVYLHVKEVFISIIIGLSQKWTKDYLQKMKAKINFIFNFPGPIQ